MRRVWIGGIALLAVVSSSPALAQEKSSSEGATVGTLGVRGGFSLTPDQFVIGAQVSLGKKLGIARVVPSVDVGLGSSVTTIAFNGDLQVRLSVEGSKFSLYGGAGPTLLYTDDEGGSGRWDVGLTLLAGCHVPIRVLPFNFEARFGVGDVPDFRGLIILEL